MNQCSQCYNWTSISIKDLASKEHHSFIDGDWIEAPHITTSGIRLIQTGNIGIGFFVNKNQKFISESSFKELNCKEVYTGDSSVRLDSCIC